ncbi:MAG: tetratricopeptide repeat protein [Pseudomonadota bacterium]
MRRSQTLVTLSVASFLLFAPSLVVGQESDLDDLFENLKSVGPEAAQAIESRIWTEWGRSGSPTLDLLLERGREALQNDDPVRSIEHATALIDHAPDFAEAYNLRATAYFQRGLYGPSIEDIRTTLALNPRHFGAMAGLGLVLEELGYAEEALEAWREVVSIHPHQMGAREAIERLERMVEGTAL